MSPSEQTGRLTQTSTLHRIHLALTRSLCFWFKISRLAVWCWTLHLKPGKLTSLLYYPTNDQSSIFSLHSLELCTLKRCLTVCLKHHKTLWNCIVFLKGLKCLACLALVSSQNIARSPGATRVTTWYNFPLQPLGSTPSAAPNGWCLPAIEVVDAAHSWRDPKCQTVAGLKSLSNRVKA